MTTGQDHRLPALFCASANPATSGVLPVPPEVMLPMQITGISALKGEAKTRRSHDQQPDKLKG